MCVCVQADAEGAGTVVVPHALANMGHGVRRLHVRLLFPREVRPTLHPRPPTSQAGSNFYLLTCPPATVQVQTAGAVGLRRHGGASCSGGVVHGKNGLLGGTGEPTRPANQAWALTVAGGAHGHVRTGAGRPLVCGGRAFLQERRSGPFCPRHLAPFRGSGG